MQNKEKHIIFLEPWPTIMIYKIARLFKKQGYKTTSIRVLQSEGLSLAFYKKAFDQIICFNLSFFKLKLKNIPLILRSLSKKLRDVFKAVFSILKLKKPYVIFCRATPSWLCALTKKTFKKHPVIYFPYDIRSLRYPTKEIAKKDRELSEFEIKSERFCFEKADGIMHKGDPDEIKYMPKGLLGADLKVNPLQLAFHPYCSEEFIVPFNKNKLSKKDNETHLVYLSSQGSRGSKGHSNLFDYFREIIKQKIHIHSYTKPNTCSKKDVIDSFRAGCKDVLDSKYFHLHEPLGPKEIIKEISKYDFGIFPFLESESEDSPAELNLKFLIGNKVSSYLEAGIPFFYPKKNEFIDKVMRKYKLDIYMEDVKDIKNLKKRIKKLNYKELEKKIEKARKDFLMEKQFPRLEKFIKKVRAKNNKA